MAKYTLEQYKRKIERWASDMPKTVKIALQKAGEIVRGEAIYSHLSGPKMAKGIGSKTRATLARQTGNLAASVKVRSKVTGKKISASVGSNLVYAAIHEFGMSSRNMPERSYLRSSLRAKRKQILDTILKDMVKSYEQR